MSNNDMIFVASAGEFVLVTPASIKHPKFGKFAEVDFSNCDFPTVVGCNLGDQIIRSEDVEEYDWFDTSKEDSNWIDVLRTESKYLIEILPFGPVSIGKYENGEEYRFRITAPLTQQQVGLLIGIDSPSQKIWEGCLPVAEAVVGTAYDLSWWNPFTPKFRLPNKEEVKGHWPDCWVESSDDKQFTARKLQLVITC